jgi:hypothetical protein
MVEFEERNVTWKFLLAFLLGCIFAEVTADVISDYLFFHRVASGQPLSPTESVIYWYYLPALVYTGLFVAAFILMKTHTITARQFAYLIVFLAAAGTVKAWLELGGDGTILLLLTVPLLLLAFAIFYRRKS